MFVHPEINYLFDTEIQQVQTIIIENQAFFLKLLTQINEQIEDFDGKCVLSENDSPIPFAKNAEILDRFVPFDINRKPLLTKIATALEKVAMVAEKNNKTMRILAQLENYLDEIAFLSDCSITFPKLSVSGIIKSASPELPDDYDSLGEKILDYMELVREFDRRKLFFTVNLRSYLSDNDAELFMKSVISHGFHLIMLENKEYGCSEYEKRLIIDSDLCEIV